MFRDNGSKLRGILLLGAAVAATALPAQAGVSISRNSASIVLCPAEAATIYHRVAPPSGGCDVGGVGPVVDTWAASFGYVAVDNVDGLATNEAGPANSNYHLLFSGDITSLGVGGTAYNNQVLLGQAPADIFRTANITNNSPRAVMAGACGAPAMIAPPAPRFRNQTDFNLIPTLPPWAASAANPDDVDGFELDVLDTTGDQIHDRNFYISVDAASPSWGGSPADILFVPAGGVPGLWAPVGALGLGSGDDVDALVVWDRGVVGNPNPGTDLVLFSLARGSAALAGGDGILGTADDYSPADIFVSDLTGVFCLYTRHSQLGLLFTDNVDALDVND